MSTFVPLSEKYRPRTFAELVGQDVLTRTITNDIKNKRVPHAIMLCGPSGVGKTTTGRIIAASLNCEKGQTVDPCGTCQNCVDILEGRSADVTEIDAASHGQIENIRDLKVEAAYRAVGSKYRIFIIDECQGITPKGFDAMLKLLEEPPEDCKFILCTTERQKMKHTVIARCSDFNLNLLPWNLIAAHLKTICQKESIQINDDALKAVSKHADGHMRDALKHLDSVLSYAGSDKITGEIAHAALGTADDNLYFDLVNAVINKSFSSGVKTIQQVLLTGQNASAVVNGILNHLRTLMVISICENTSGIICLTEEEKKRFVHQRQLMKPSVIADMILSLIVAHRGLFYSVSPQVLLEHFLFESIKSHHKQTAATG